MSKQALTVLLVEDDDIDAEAVERGFRKLDISNSIVRAHNGIEALDILRGEQGRSDLQRPFLILLDINMPRMNGLETLQEIREDDDLQNSVVFMLTTSENPGDRQSAYKLNVAGYINKTDVGPNFNHAARLIEDYRQVVTLPE